MKKSATFILFLFALYFAKAQYISEITEYKPAPGQFTNTTYGDPDAAQSIIGTANGIVSLGAFGGYIIFKFENPITNNPDNPYGIDFTVFGNPANNLSAEPGTVSVMKDENKNGLPDDTWYELAGSDYFFSSTIKNYSVTYTNPDEPVATDIPWTDNAGNSGFVYANDYHTQPYYPLADIFPEINQNNYTLNGTKINAYIDKSNPAYIKSHKRAFGYADNNIRGDISSNLPDNPYTPETEGYGGDAFDILWAVDQNGNYVYPDTVNFIKINTAVNDNMSWLGEVSTEISGAIATTPSPGTTGQDKILVIKDLPPVLFTEISYNLEAFAFENGILQPSADISWQTDMTSANISSENILTLSEPGTITLTAVWNDFPDITASITLEISEGNSINKKQENRIYIYPNPATDYIKIKNAENYHIEIFTLSGKKILDRKNRKKNSTVKISSLKPGFYIIKINNVFSTLTVSGKK